MEITLRPKGFFRVDKENKTLQFTRLSYTTMPIPPNLLNFDRLNRQKRSAIYRLGDGNLTLLREKVLFVRDRMVTPNRVIKAEYFKFLSTLISNGIRFRLYIKKNLAALICYEQSHTYSYEGIPPEKLMVVMEEMQYKVSIFDNIPGLVKKKQIRFEGGLFRVNMDKKLLEVIHRDALQTVLKQVYKKLAKSSFDSDNYKNNSGGINFTLKGEDFRLPGVSRINPTRQVIQGRQAEIHMWLRKHLKDHNYDRMLVVGGIKPEGFTEISVDDMRTDLINIIRQNYSDKEMWISIFQVMEKAYAHNNFTQGVVKLLHHYFEAVNKELYDRIDIHTFTKAVPGLSEADFVTKGVNSVFARYNHLQMMAKGYQELPKKIFLPMNGTMQDIITTIALLKVVGDENAEFIDFIMINDPNLSDFIASSSVNKIFEKMFVEITTVYHSNNILLNLFQKMDRLILRHSKMSRDYVTTLYDDPLLWMAPVFISAKNDIIWIDEPEIPVLSGHQLLFEFHPDYDRIFNSSIDNFDQMIEEVKTEFTKEDLEEDNDEIFEDDQEIKEEENCEKEKDDYEKEVEEIKESVDEKVSETPKDEAKDEYREVHRDIIGKDAEEMADDLVDSDTLDINTVIQDYKTDFEFSEYVAKSEENVKDTQKQIEIFETIVTFFEVIEVIKRSNSDSLELSKIDTVHHVTIDKMVSFGLLNRENIDENTSHIMMTREGKEMFSETMSKVKTLRDDIRMGRDVYFENIDVISAHCRGPGPNSGIKTVISMGQLYSVVYLNYSTRIPPLLLATFEFWEDQSIDNPGSFLAYLDSGYLQKIHSIKGEILLMREPKEEVKTAEVPSPVLNETVVPNDFEMEPVIRDKNFLSPKKKIPIKTIPQGVTDINEQIKDAPVGPKKRWKRVPSEASKKKEKKKTLTMDEVRKKINQRELINELVEKGDRVRQKKVLMSSEERDMGEIVKNLSILDLKLTAKIKKELASDDIHYIDQFMELDTSTMDLSITMLKEIGDLRDTIGDRIERNADFQDIFMKSRLDFFISLGGVINPEFISKNVVYPLPVELREIIKENISSDTKDSFREQVYNCFMKIMDLDNPDQVDQHIRVLQRKNNPMIYDGEFSEFSIGWLYSSQDTIEENREKLRDMVANMHINNIIDKRLRIGLENEEPVTEEEDIESETVESD